MATKIITANDTIQIGSGLPRLSDIEAMWSA